MAAQTFTDHVFLNGDEYRATPVSVTCNYQIPNEIVLTIVDLTTGNDVSAMVSRASLLRIAETAAKLPRRT